MSSESMKSSRPRSDGNTPVSSRRLSEREAELAWIMPALGYMSGFGISSKKLVRHCIIGEPLDPHWERPFDNGDLVRATRTANAAPPHLREKAQAALAQYREWLAADKPEYVALADAELAALSEPEEPR